MKGQKFSRHIVCHTFVPPFYICHWQGGQSPICQFVYLNSKGGKIYQGGQSLFATMFNWTIRRRGGRNHITGQVPSPPPKGIPGCITFVVRWATKTELSSMPSTVHTLYAKTHSTKAGSQQLPFLWEGLMVANETVTTLSMYILSAYQFYSPPPWGKGGVEWGIMLPLTGKGDPRDGYLP